MPTCTIRPVVDIDKIRRLRLKLGLSQQEAAQKAGLKTRQAWNRIESGTHIPTLPTISKVAAALGVSAKELLK